MAETLNPYKQTYLRLLSEIGKAGLNALYPNDFEFYLIALELVDSDGKAVESFIFPVNPESLSEVNTNIVNIQKTNQGVSVLKTRTWIPTDISLSGNFGRRFKFLLGKGSVDAAAVGFNFTTKNGEAPPKEFNTQVKTGYGCCKLLDRIINRGNTLDEKGNPYRLYFYNLAFGTAYMVEHISLIFKQDFPASNMIWNYNLNLKTIAPLTGSLVNDPKKLTTLTTLGTIQKSINLQTKLLDGELKRQINNRSRR